MQPSLKAFSSVPIQDADTVLQRLDAEIEKIPFDPRAPGSLEAAVIETSLVIDRMKADFDANPMLKPLASKLKTQYLERLHDRAAASEGGALPRLKRFLAVLPLTAVKAWRFARQAPRK